MATWISCDVEADGPIPGKYSMTALGAVVIEPGLKRSFLGYLRPMYDEYIPEAQQVGGFTRDEELQFPDPKTTMLAFRSWISEVSKGNPSFVADNNGFDYSFVNWYFHYFQGDNPFGFSSRNINSLWHGMQKNCRESFKHLRITKHTHNPVDDARGNAEAVLQMVESFGLKGTGIILD